MRGLVVADEELTSIRVRTFVRHRHHAAAVVLLGVSHALNIDTTYGQLVHELVLKGLAVNTRATLARAGRISALDHESGYVAVKERVVVVLTGTQREEVLVQGVLMHVIYEWRCINVGLSSVLGCTSHI